MPAVDRSRTIRTAARLANLDLNDFMMENFEAVLDQQSQMMAEQQALQQTVEMAAGQQALQGPPNGGRRRSDMEARQVRTYDGTTNRLNRELPMDGEE